MLIPVFLLYTLLPLSSITYSKRCNFFKAARMLWNRFLDLLSKGNQKVVVEQMGLRCCGLRVSTWKTGVLVFFFY